MKYAWFYTRRLVKLTSVESSPTLSKSALCGGAKSCAQDWFNSSYVAVSSIHMSCFPRDFECHAKNFQKYRNTVRLVGARLKSPNKVSLVHHQMRAGSTLSDHVRARYCQRIQAEHLASEVHVQRRARAECTLSMQSPHRSRMRRPVLELPCRGLHAERGGIDGSWRMT